MPTVKQDGAAPPPAPAKAWVMLMPPSKKSGDGMEWPTPSVASEVSQGVVTVPLKAGEPEAFVVAQMMSVLPTGDRALAVLAGAERLQVAATRSLVRVAMRVDAAAVTRASGPLAVAAASGRP